PGNLQKANSVDHDTSTIFRVTYTQLDVDGIWRSTKSSSPDIKKCYLLVRAARNIRSRAGIELASLNGNPSDIILSADHIFLRDLLVRQARLDLHIFEVVVEAHIDLSVKVHNRTSIK